jgi:hypothetical protein
MMRLGGRSDFAAEVAELRQLHLDLEALAQTTIE